MIRSVRLHHTLVIRHMNKSHELVMVIYLKAVGELLAREGLKSKDLIDVIKQNFRRDFIVDDYQICIGHQEKDHFE